MVGTFKIDTFCEGDIFRVVSDSEHVVEMTLEKIYEGKYKSPFSERNPFRLMFKMNKDFLLEPGCHLMEQTRVGSFEIAINPIVAPQGINDEFYYYEAVFS